VNIAHEVVTRLTLRVRIPDDLVRLIYLGLERTSGGIVPFGIDVDRHEGDEIVRYVTTLHTILSRLPEYGETGSFRVKVRDLVRLTDAEVYGLVHGGRMASFTARQVEKFTNGYDGDFIDHFLRGSVYYLVLNYYVHIDIPLDLFFQHCHIMAASGYGKTVLTERLTHRHIEEGVCVLCMAPKGLLLPQLAMLDFEPERLTYISPALWGSRPLALNVFKVFGTKRLTQNEETHICDLVNYLFSDVDPTPKQKVLLTNATRLLIRVPDASLLTLYELMECEKFPEHFIPYIDHGNKLQVSFFMTDFANRKMYGETKDQLKWRIQSLLDNAHINRAFTQDRCDFDLMRLIDRPSVILVDTSLQHLGTEGSRFFGRFFFALLTMAMRIRGAGRNHYPVVAYIDECATYLDDNVTTMLELARDARIGLVLIHQQLQQLRSHSSALEASLKANTRIKFVGKVDHSDAVALSHAMRVEASDLEHQDEFWFHMKYASAGSVRLFAPPGYLARKPKRRVETLYRKLLADAEGTAHQEEPKTFVSLTYSAKHYTDNDIE
jgi:hypothetical protein